MRSLIVIAGAAGAALTVAGVRSPVTGALTLLFVLFVPAVCVALLLPGLDPLGRAIAAGTASLTLCAAVAEIMLAASAWSPRGGVIAIALISAAPAAVAGIRRSRKNPPQPVRPDEDSWAFEP
jgi:hypothetical protein